MSSPCSFFLQINAAVVFAHPRMYTMTFNVAVYRIVSYRIVSYIIVLHRIASGHIIVAWHVRGERRWILSFWSEHASRIFLRDLSRGFVQDSGYSRGPVIIVNPRGAQTRPAQTTIPGTTRHQTHHEENRWCLKSSNAPHSSPS